MDNPTRTELQSSTLHSYCGLKIQAPGHDERSFLCRGQLENEISSQRPLDFFDMCGRKSGEGPLLLRPHFVTFSLPEGSLDCIHSRTDLETTRTSARDLWW